MADATTNVGDLGNNNEITCGMMVVDTKANCKGFNPKAQKKVDVSTKGIKKAFNLFGFVEIQAYDGGIKNEKGNKNKGTEGR